MPTRFLALFVVVFVAAGARADIVTLGASDSYTPGNPFTVDVGLTPVDNLGLYNVELVFRSFGASPGWLMIDPPAAAASGYVFPSGDNFFGSSLVVGNEYRLTLSDFTLNSIGPNVLAGVNDRIGMVTVRPISTLTSPIEVSIDRSSLLVDDASGNSLLTGGSVPSVVLTPITPDPNPVPAPGGLVLGVVAIGVLAAWRSRKRKTQEVEGTQVTAEETESPG